MRIFPAVALFCALLAGACGGGLRAAHGDPRLPVERLHGAHWGMQVVDLADGRVVFTHAADNLMVPASCMKLLTAAAMLIWDHGQRWQRPLTTQASIVDGRVVWLKGRGDPSLTTADLDALVAAIVAKGADAVELVLDDRGVWNARLGPGWAWDDETEDYSAPLGAFGVNENTVEVTLFPALVSSAPPRISAAPDGVLEFRSDALTVGPDGESTVSLERLEGTNVVVIHGALPTGEEMRTSVAVLDGLEYVRTLLQQGLRRAGLGTVVRRVGAEEEGMATALWRHVSPPLHDLVRHMLKVSDNYYAEQLMRQLGSPSPRASDGLELAAANLQSRFGLVAGTYRQVDGSGLSRMNLLSAAQLVTVLNGAARERSFVDALPIAGIDGTLARRFKTSPLRGLLRAKTGSMSGVSSLAGYLCDIGGRPRYAFAFILNGAVAPVREVKAVEEATVEAVLGPFVAR